MYECDEPLKNETENEPVKTASDPGLKDASSFTPTKRRSASAPVGTSNGGVFSAKINDGVCKIKRENGEKHVKKDDIWRRYLET